MATQTATSTTLNPTGNIYVEMTEYDPATKKIIRQISSVNFGITSLQRKSTPVVIKMNVVGVRKISNIQLAIIRCSELISASGIKYPDGSYSEGNFGIEHSSTLEEKTNLTRFFGGINILLNPVYENNVLIINTSNTESEFVYLNIKTPNVIERGYIGYKWFFDFS